MPVWKKLLVVLPAFLILHLTATGAVPLTRGFGAAWQAGTATEIYLLAALPAGYAAGVVIGIAARTGATRATLALSLVLSILGIFCFTMLANGWVAGSGALILIGMAAGMALPVTARVLGLADNVVPALIMAMLVIGGWWLSIPFSRSLTIGHLPGWAGPYFAQGALCVLWLPLVVLLGSDRRVRRLK